METIKTKLKILAKTGGIKTEHTGDNWINPTPETKKAIMDNFQAVKHFENKQVIINLVDDKSFSGIGLAEEEDKVAQTEEKGYTEEYVKDETVDKVLDKPKEQMSEKSNIKNHKIKDKHIINIKGKEFITFEGLLDVAHEKGLKSIQSELVSSENDNYIFRARVTLKDDRFFEAYGDANPNNVNSMMKDHIIRLADTRALSRALRWATNVGMCSVDELKGDKE